MNDAEHDFGMISMTQAVDSYHIFLSFFYFYFNAANLRILTYYPCLSTETHALLMYLYLHTCFAFLSPIIYLTAVICFIFVVSLFAGEDLQVLIRACE